MVGLQHYLVLSSILFAIGLYGALTKRNTIVILMCIEIMLNAVNIALVAFSRFTAAGLTGQIFAIFIIVVAAAEACVGLAILISVYRNRKTIQSDKMDMLKW